MTVALAPGAPRRLALLLAAGLALPGTAALAAEAAAPAAAAASTAAASRTPEPAVQRTVNEDDHVRVEELRVRGRTRSIHVQPKTPGAPAYEVLPGDGAPDAGGSADGKRPGGERVWNVLKF
jgi:hypothetical protein